MYNGGGNTGIGAGPRTNRLPHKRQPHVAKRESPQWLTETDYARRVTLSAPAKLTRSSAECYSQRGTSLGSLREPAQREE